MSLQSCQVDLNHFDGSIDINFDSSQWVLHINFGPMNLTRLSEGQLRGRAVGKCRPVEAYVHHIKLCLLYANRKTQVSRLPTCNVTKRMYEYTIYYNAKCVFHFAYASTCTPTTIHCARTNFISGLKITYTL